MEGAFFEFWMKVLKSHLTKLITSLGAILVYRGVIEESDKAEFIAGAIAFAISSAITIWRAHGDTIKTAVAAWLPRGATMEDVKKEIANKSTPTPKLLGILLVLALGGLGFTGCAGNRKPPERQVAIIALQVISGVDAVAKTSEELHASKVLTDAQFKSVVTRLREVYAQTSRLADALKAYDQLASPDTASQVAAALNALAVLVPNVAADVTGPAGQKIAALVAEVNKLLITVAQAVGPRPTARLHFNPHVVGGVA